MRRFGAFTRIVLHLRITWFSKKVMNIRPLKPEDKNEIIRLHMALFYPEFPKDELEQEGADMLRADPQFWMTLVAEYPLGTLCGYICGSIRDETPILGRMKIGYVEAWYVDPGMRQQGIGTALYQQLEQWFRERGCRLARSDTDLENQISVNAHTRQGFSVSDRVIEFTKPLGQSDEIN